MSVWYKLLEFLKTTLLTIHPDEEQHWESLRNTYKEDKK